jgi:lysyl-tRNA synthetase class 1
MPLQISYTHASLLGQLFDPKKDIKKILESLKNTGHVKGKISDKDKEYLKTRITHAKNWAEKYAPNYRIRIQEKPPLEKLSKEQIEVLKILKKELTKKWTEEKLQARIYKIKDELNLPAPKVFQAIYLALLGQNQGPRAGQLILTLGKKRVLKILEKL